jgi:hypothetical protein
MSFVSNFPDDILLLYKIKLSWAPVARACNPCYSVGSDQEDHSSKPVRANSSQDPISKKSIRKGWWNGSRYRPILKIPITKKGLVEWLKV